MTDRRRRACRPRPRERPCGRCAGRGWTTWWSWRDTTMRGQSPPPPTPRCAQTTGGLSAWRNSSYLQVPTRHRDHVHYRPQTKASVSQQHAGSLTQYVQLTQRKRWPAVCNAGVCAWWRGARRRRQHDRGHPVRCLRREARAPAARHHRAHGPRRCRPPRYRHTAEYTPAPVHRTVLRHPSWMMLMEMQGWNSAEVQSAHKA